MQQSGANDANGAGDVVFRGKLITVRVQTTTRQDGSTSRFELVEHPGAVAIVAVRTAPGGAAEPEVAFVRQMRPAIGRETLELPAGLIHDSEHSQPEVTAARELREETGYTPGNLRLLTRHYPSPGYTNEAISIYLATNLTHDANAIPDPHEIAQVRWIALGEALRMGRDGEINDGKTLLGLWLARDVLTADAFLP